MTLKTGDSYYSLRRDDFALASFSVWDVPMEFLPTRYAPLEKQLRVFVNDEEYTFDDDIDPSLTTKLWSWAEGSPVTGVPCYGVRFTFSPPTGSGADIAEFGIWTNGVFRTAAELEIPATDSYDGDPSTDENYSTTPDTQEYLFHTEQYVTKVGWSRPISGFRQARTMNITLNLGTPEDPNWVNVGSMTDIDLADYPAFSTPYNPETDLLTIDMPAKRYKTHTPVTVTITPALAVPSDRLTLVRETRQDEPWIRPFPGSYGYGASVYDYWRQLLYIYQEMCEISTVAPLVGLPVASLVPNDYTAGNQVAYGTNDGTSQTVVSFSTLELLTGIPGAPSDPAHQIIVEEGNTTNGASTGWSTVAASGYTIDASAKTVTLDSGTTADLRVRRVTRKDKLWADIDTVGPIGWNTAIIVMLQKQLRFLREEACFLPVFYIGHPLGNPIFPRAWNWLNFTGGGGSFTFGGPSWGGDGVVQVYQNDVLLTPGTDYELNWPEIVLTTPAGPTDVVTIGGGGGGFGYPSFPNGDEDSESGIVTGEPGEPQDPVQWPGLDLALGFTIAVSTGDPDDLTDGTWEGGTVVSSPAPPSGDFTPFYLKILVTVTDADAADFNHSGVVYLRGACSEDATSLHTIAVADDSTGDGTFNQTDTVSAALGCLDGNAATSQNLVRSKLAGLTRSASTNPLIALALGALSDLQDADINGDVNNIPFIGSWFQLVQDSQAAADAGVVSDAGFTAEQFQNYIDPDVDFDDFDIPLP